MIKYIFIILLLFLSCRRDTNPISDEEEVTPPREYEWTVDSLTIPNTFQISVDDMWGSSAKDIYTVGYGTPRGKMFHYDGKTWQTVKLQTSEGGPIENILQLWSIHGFSSTNIFAAGYKEESDREDYLALLIHYDGRQWNEIPVEGKGLHTVWGLSHKDIWIGGLYGTLMHYNGNKWTKFSMLDSIWIKDIAGFATDDVYAIAYSVSPYFTFFMYHWDGKNWRLQDRFRVYSEPETFGSHRLKIIGSDIYSVGYGGVFHKSVNNTAWKRIKYSPLIFDISGSSRQNLIAVGRGGIASHYNGEGWQLYQDIYNSHLEYTACWADVKEAFVAGYNGSFTYIFHGK